MIDFNNCHLFTPFTHPESGVTFQILRHEVARGLQGVSTFNFVYYREHGIGDRGPFD